MRVFKYDSPIGDIHSFFEGEFLVEVAIGATPYEIIPPCPPLEKGGKGGFKKELDAYFKGEAKHFKQKIKFVKGTPFEQKVWLALNEAPYGETRAYKWVAERIGSPKALRAVGQALKKNPLPIILPCHRVIASDGSIGGFSCGVEIKRWLLRHESELHDFDH